MARKLGVTDRTIRSWRRKYTNLNRKSSFIKSNKINEMLDIQLAYIAGILDGEGNIFNNKVMYPKIYITNNSIVIMKYLQEITGVGNVRMHMEPNRLKTNRKPTYIWGLTNMGGIRNFLNLLLPFLIIKKQQARLAIKLINIREKRVKRDGKTGRFLKYIHTNEEVEIYKQNKELNRRGLENEIKVKM